MNLMQFGAALAYIAAGVFLSSRVLIWGRNSRIRILVAWGKSFSMGRMFWAFLLAPLGVYGLFFAAFWDLLHKWGLFPSTFVLWPYGALYIAFTYFIWLHVIYNGGDEKYQEILRNSRKRESA